MVANESLAIVFSCLVAIFMRAEGKRIIFSDKFKSVESVVNVTDI